MGNSKTAEKISKGYGIVVIGVIIVIVGSWFPFVYHGLTGCPTGMPMVGWLPGTILVAIIAQLGVMLSFGYWFKKYN